MIDIEILKTNVKNKMTTKEMSLIMNISEDMVRYYIRKFNIKKSYNDKRKHTFTEDYFENINTKEKAYILGFFASDGYLKNNRSICFQIHKKDIEVLYFIKNELKYTGEIKIFEKKNQCLLILHSIKMYNSIKSLGFKNNKTFDCFIPTCICDNLVSYYIRGLFDGDGNINKHNAKLATASETLKNQIERINNDLFEDSLWIKKYNKTYSIVFNKKNKNFLFWVYAQEKIGLNRKYENLYQYWL